MEAPSNGLLLDGGSSTTDGADAEAECGFFFQTYCLPVTTSLVLKTVAMASKVARSPRLTTALKL